MKSRLRYLLYMLRIRRVEFRVAEIPIILIPILLLVRHVPVLKTFFFWEGIFLFFLLFAFGDMVNCLADRDLDAVYKPHLSEAVYGLGVRFVTFQVVTSALVALIVSAHLAWQLNRWLLVPLVGIGLMLGAAYSVPPFRLKGRGLAQLFCLWLIIFVGPMWLVSMLIDSWPTPQLLIFAAAYGGLQMGVILVNTAEDYPEDLEAGIKTTIVSLGLHRGIGLAFWLTAAGVAGAIGALAVIFWQRRLTVGWWLLLLPAAAAAVFVLMDILRLKLSIAGVDLAASIKTVKQAARKVPIWLTLVAWSMAVAAWAVFMNGAVAVQ
ncbi:MAG TPA: UbiA family prenyltransferase [Pyrinomonadaceae bacterium]|nr:UbiA family prenyltransferase [Pyrinomonadaceae bacterium]